MESQDPITYEIQSLFYQGAYESCVDNVRQNSSGSPSDPLVETRLLYGARASIALNDTTAALALLPPASMTSAASNAVRSLASYVAAQNLGDSSKADDELAKLHDILDEAILGDASGQTIRVCVATAMARDNDPVGALEILGIGSATSKEIECIALGVHILLSINRPDIAQKEYAAARAWADDSLLIQLIEAYIGVYEGGRAAQQAYYVYDELAQNPSHADKPSSVSALTGKAVARLVSGEYADADTILTQAHQLNAQDTNVLANKVPTSLLATTTGQQAALDTSLSQLRAVSAQDSVLQDLAAKDIAFEDALQKHQEALASS